MLAAARSTVMDRGTRATGSPYRRASVAVALVAAIIAGVAIGRFLFIDLVGTPALDAPRAAAHGDLPTATEALAADPTNPALQTRLGAAYLAEARRTADPTLYARADELISRSRAAAPGETSTLVGAGLLALARHDFAGALELASEAKRLAPLSVDPLGVEIDALVELGRYEEAASAVDEMVRRRPDVASLSRASYVMELTGRRDDAVDAMQQAVAAAPERTSDRAYVLALLGDLQLGRGRLDAADAAYRRSLDDGPDNAQAELGLARVLVARGDLRGASASLAALTERLPLPDAVALYGDVLAASGDDTGAARQRDLVRAIEALNASAGGVSVDLELARFEAAQIGRPGGDAGRAIDLATRARAARPTVFADDTLGWALQRAGRPAEALPLAVAAVRTDIGDATIWWHLAAIQSDLGRDNEARVSLTRVFDLGGPLPLLEAPEARATAARLGVAVSGRE